MIPEPSTYLDISASLEYFKHEMKMTYEGIAWLNRFD